MNRTEVAEVWDVPPTPEEAEGQLRKLLRRAADGGLGVSIAGARHTMGGHTICPDGIVVNMLPFRQMELDERANVLRVGAGALWADVLPFLNRRGRSVAIMQSNSSFSVGGSVSANCHGWTCCHPPIASSALAFRLMKADGSVVRCSRTENAELFRLALGGYGLFGIILDVDLHVVPNERYRPEAFIVPSDRYVETFREKVRDAEGVGMAYGRLCVVPGKKTFLREAILTRFHRMPLAEGEVPPVDNEELAGLRRLVFRASVGNKLGKEVRWAAEKEASRKIGRYRLTRNQILNEGVEVYEDRSDRHADVLHEYFVPPAAFDAFLEALREIIPRYNADLLNLTVRDVRRDPDAFLEYADQDVLGLVMLFSQRLTPEADRHMEALTRELIDAVLAVGGRYYLPYRLHATREQFFKAYPQAGEFFRLKRRHDPRELFQNHFYRKYGKG
jgi:FAD/FMN-containing dehydrogenase